MTTSNVERDGFALVRGALADAERERILAAIGPADVPGRRGLLSVPQVAVLARSATLVNSVRPHVVGEPFPVRAILFNKSPRATRY